MNSAAKAISTFLNAPLIEYIELDDENFPETVIVASDCVSQQFTPQGLDGYFNEQSDVEILIPGDSPNDTRDKAKDLIVSLLQDAKLSPWRVSNVTAGGISIRSAVTQGSKCVVRVIVTLLADYGT